MLIEHSNGNGFTNMRNVCRVLLTGRAIQAYMVDGSNHILGYYESAERATEVYMHMVTRMRTRNDIQLPME